jgi:hypothetical protein
MNTAVTWRLFMTLALAISGGLSSSVSAQQGETLYAVG